MIEFLAPLSDASLLPRHFEDIRVTRRQLALWAELCQARSASTRASGKWRFLAPLDVLGLAVVSIIVERTGVQLLEDTPMLRYLRDAQAFCRPALQAWADARPLMFVTDFEEGSMLVAADAPSSSFLPKPGHVSCLIALEPCFQLMAAAIQSGGNDAQRSVLSQMIGHRLAMQKHANRSMGTDEATSRSDIQLTPREPKAAVDAFQKTIRSVKLD